MQADPRRIPDHQIEAKPGVRRTEVGGKGEGQGAVARNVASLTTQRGTAQALYTHFVALLRSRLHALAEEIRRSPGEKPLTSQAGERVEVAVDRRERAAPFLACQRAPEWRLPRTGSAHIALAQPNKDRRWPHDGRRLRESLAGQCVSHADVAVEVGQRRHGGHSGLLALDHHREPEAQLTEPHCGGIDVHSVNGARQYVAPNRCHAAGVAGGAVEQRKSFQHEDQKRPGSAGGVEHCEPVKTGAQPIRRVRRELLTA